MKKYIIGKFLSLLYFVITVLDVGFVRVEVEAADYLRDTPLQFVFTEVAGLLVQIKKHFTSVLRGVGSLFGLVILPLVILYFPLRTWIRHKQYRDLPEDDCQGLEVNVYKFYKSWL